MERLGDNRALLPVGAEINISGPCLGIFEAMAWKSLANRVYLRLSRLLERVQGPRVS